MWFRKQKPKPEPRLSDALVLDDPRFVEFVRSLVSDAEPGARTMSTVALHNLRYIFPESLPEKYEGERVPLASDLDGQIRFLGSRNYDEERAFRRNAWFLWAALITRATNLAERASSAQEAAAEIWEMLAREAQFIEHRLTHNIVWSDQEKVWFSHIKSEKDGVSYVLNHMLPSWLKQHPRIKACANEFDVFIFNR